MGRGLDITNQRFGKLVAIRRVGTSKQQGAIWLCQCDCGKTAEVVVSVLNQGETRSCGCLYRTHGMSETSEYKIWKGMKGRCYNPNDTEYHNYGGRGVTVYEEWLNDFMAFYNHIGPRPTADHSVDRIDVNGNYEPGNVRWATATEQSNNKRNNRLIPFRGELMTCAEVARLLGVSRQAVHDRLKRRGFVEDR